MLRRHDYVADDDQTDDGEPRCAEEKRHCLGVTDDDARDSTDTQGYTHQWHEEGRYKVDRQGNRHSPPSQTRILPASISKVARQAMACENEQRTNEKADAHSQPLPCSHTSKRDFGPARQVKHPAGRDKVYQSGGGTQEGLIDRACLAGAQCPKGLVQVPRGAGPVWQVRDLFVEFWKPIHGFGRHQIFACPRPVVDQNEIDFCARQPPSL
jgi:hypothetical protein